MRIGERVQDKACLVCASEEREIVATLGRGFVPLTTGICPGCGLVSHAPLPDAAEVHAFYAQKYRVDYKGGYEPKRKHSLRAIRGAVARAKRLAPYLPVGARVLDIGASSGEFTYAMTRAGLAATGIEPNQGYAAFARRAYSVDIINAPLEEVDLADSSFDLITLNHVFEHLVDPLKSLTTIRRWLKPNGVLFIEVPNLAGVRKQVINTFHYAHIWNFTPETLIAVLHKAGFAPLPDQIGTSTSLVFAKVASAEPSDPVKFSGAAERIKAQIRNEQSFLSYVLSGAPFARRWARLNRNIDELRTTKRFATVRDMADAIIDQARIEPRASDRSRHAA